MGDSKEIVFEKTQENCSEQELQQERRDEENLDSISVPYDHNASIDYKSKAYQDNAYNNDEEKGRIPETITDNDENDNDDDQSITSISRSASRTTALARALSLVRTRSIRNTAPLPDGDLVAWSQVLFAHLVIANTWGYTNAFGFFQTYYTETLHQSPSDVSWIGSVQTWLVFFIGTFSGRATDAGYFKFTWACGMFIAVLSLFMTSLCTEYWQIFLSQGVMQGLGSGLMFCPTMSLLPTYFQKRRALAISSTAAGAATGGLIIPAMVNALLGKVGFAWTLRIMGFFTLGTLLPSLLFLKQRLPPRSGGPFLELSAFKEVPYSCFAFGMFFIFWGLYVGFFYVSSYAKDILGASTSTSTDLLMVMSAVGIPGRILPGLISDLWTGPLNLLIPYAICSAAASYGWNGVHSVPGLYVWAAIYGIASAGVQGLFPVGITSLTDDLKKIGARMGQVMTIVSFAALTGNPIAGALVQADNGGYLYMQMFMGSVITLGMALLVVAKVHRFGFAWVKG